jgi:hypothetical protein
MDSGSSRRLIMVATCSVASTALALMLTRIWLNGATRYPGTFADDFFYYVEIAVRIAHGQGSTFDGITSTNGYHPLWMLCLLVGIGLCGSGPPLFVGVGILAAIGGVLTLLIATRLSRRLLADSGNLSVFVGAYTAAVYWREASHGMEILLTVPLLLCLISDALAAEDVPPPTAASFRQGLLAAVLVLSRLDSILFVALFVLARACMRPGSIRARWHGIGPWLLGFTPVFAYLIFNLSEFGRFLPISGAAKQLKPLGRWTPPSFELSLIQRCLLVYAGTALLPLAALALWRQRSRWRPQPTAAAALTATLAFPFLFYAVRGTLSDWPMWPWYLYPLMVSIPIALPLTATLLPARQRRAADLAIDRGVARLGDQLYVFAAAVPLLLALVTIQQPRLHHSFYELGQRLSVFAKEHPGIYAMGDRAGAVAYQMHQSVLQLEGLVADQTLIDHLRHRHDLPTTLRQYGVNYYIASRVQRRGSCYATTEPAMAGPDSPRMHGTFCQRPLLIDQASDDKITSMVFAIPSD